MFNTISSVIPINEQLLGRVFLKIIFFVYCLLMLDHSKTSLLQKEGEGGEGKQIVFIFLVDFFFERR